MGLKRIGIFAIVIMGVCLVFITSILSKSTTELAASVNSTSITSVPTSTLSNFDPAYYGLPATIAGYRIILVQTSENFACLPEGMINLVLRSESPSVDTLLNQSSNSDVMSELKKHDIRPAIWGTQYVGPGVTDAEVWQLARQSDPKIVKKCVQLGPAPTPILPTMQKDNK